MNYKPNEADWMAYLYGEQTTTEREKMERFIQESDEARNELERLKNLRTILHTLEDKEVIVPPIVIEQKKQRLLWDSPYTKTIMSIAASLTLLMVVGNITNTSVGTNEQGMYISFGEPKKEKIVTPQIEQKTITQEEVQQMINTALMQNNTSRDKTFDQNIKKIYSSVRKNETPNVSNKEHLDFLIEQAATASKEKVQQYMTTLQAENLKSIQNYITLSSTEQKDYIENLLVDFAKYLQQQRNDDLQLLQTKITDVEENNNLFKAETEQILTGLIGNKRASSTGIKN